MGKNNDAIFFIVVAFLALGFIWKPIQSQRSQNSSDSGENISETEIKNVDNKEVAMTIGDIKEEVVRIQEETAKIAEKNQRSSYYGKISADYISNLNNKDPSKEYIRINTNLGKGEQIDITGWYFKSAITGNYAKIGRVSMLPYPNKAGNLSDIVLSRGDKVIVTKGYSPVGISFRTNKCTGFFEENRNFSPSLSLNCPRPIDEDLPTFSTDLDRNDECLDIIENIYSCSTVGNSFVRDLPDTVVNACKTYLTTKINYDTCVVNHYGDSDFPGNEYRFYLNSFQKLWRDWGKTEKIHLYDNNNLIVDTIEY